jgi:16S rRNA (guanine(966)-N(2))-methyltransferase RsmD
VEGARVLDLYAGTGALGLEAVSRGAESAVFVEQNRAVLRVLRKNCDELVRRGLEPARVRIESGDVTRVLARLAARGDPFDLVFADPPYRAMGTSDRAAAEEILARAARQGIVASGGLFVLEHAADLRVETVAGFRALRHHRYGGTAITSFERRDLGRDDGTGR